MEGIETFVVNPKYTSQMCSNCKKINKCQGKKYRCNKCNLQIHRDENAAYNIANKALLERSKGGPNGMAGLQ